MIFKRGRSRNSESRMLRDREPYIWVNGQKHENPNYLAVSGLTEMLARGEANIAKEERFK
jgi:hypothetical protein